MTSFWQDLAGAVATGAAQSDNPYLKTAGGLLGGGGGSGPVVVAGPPPPPPPKAAPPGPSVGGVVKGLGWAVGIPIALGLLYVAGFFRLRRR